MGGIVTKVQPTTSTGVDSERRITRGTLLGLKLFDIFVKAGFVSDVRAGHLQDAFTTKRMLHWLIAHRTFAANKRPLPP